MRTFRETADVVFIWYFSGVIFLLAGGFGFYCVRFNPQRLESIEQLHILDGFCAWDGMWYREIVEHGYEYDTGHRSNIAFFPAYPLLAAILGKITSVDPSVALLITSNVCFLCAIAIFQKYIKVLIVDTENDVHTVSMVLFAFFPTSLFFRAAYSESLFVLLYICLYYGMRKSWPLATLSLIVGIGSGTRLLGLFLTLPLMVHAWTRLGDHRHRAASLIGIFFVGTTGLVSFIVAQFIMFGDAAAFLKVQSSWNFREVSHASLCELFCLEPLWSSLFCLDESIAWDRFSPSRLPFMNMMFLNCLIWPTFCIIVSLGYRFKIINTTEFLGAIVLLVAPFILQGPRAGMTSMGRYSAVVFPVYLILGVALSKCSPFTRYASVGLCAMMFFAMTSLFVSWHWVF